MIRRCLLIAAMTVASTAALRAETRTFAFPRIGGLPLDWCRGPSVACGRPAADAFCEARGFDNALNFARAPNVGRSRIIGTGQECTPNSFARCDGFGFVRCLRIDGDY